MKRFIALVLALVLMCALCVPAGAETEIWKYVKTNTGKGLNVRSSPDDKSKDNIVDTLPYGAMVRVDGYEKNGKWALISYEGARGCYVSTSFLVDYDPKANPDPTPTPTPTPDAPFSSFKHVTPYKAYVNTGSPTGRVYLRWAPGTTFAYMTVCYQGTDITVISEGKGWSQVIVNSNGYVGFMSQKYISKK